MQLSMDRPTEYVEAVLIWTHELAVCNEIAVSANMKFTCLPRPFTCCVYEMKQSTLLIIHMQVWLTMQHAVTREDFHGHVSGV